MDNFKGCLKSPTDVRDYKIACANPQHLPEEYEIDVLPKVKNQKNVSSCVAHSTSSILEYYELISGREHNLSTNFIYGIQKSLCGHEGKGMYLRDACKIVCKYGDMLESDCPGNNEIPKCWEIAEIALNNESNKETASAFKIKSYFSCTNNNAIKEAVMNYGPVLASIDWYDSYKPDKDGVIPTTKVNKSGGHAIMIYGWNKVGFKCQNSWGKSWGNDGRFIIPYEIKIKEARCFVDEVDTKVIIPTRNSIFDFFYKLINFFMNLFKK